MKHLFKLNKYLLRYKFRLLVGIFFVCVSNYFRVLIPQEIRTALNYINDKIKTQSTDGLGEKINFADNMGPDILKFSLIIIGFAVIMGICMFMMRMTIVVMSRLIEYDLRKDIYDKYQSLDQEFFKTQKTGDMMSRVSEDVNKVRMYLGPALLYTINISSLFVLVIYAMFQVNTTLSWYTLAPLPFLSISIYFVSYHINKKSEIIQTQLANLNSIAQEVYSGIRIVKSYAKEKLFNKFFDEQSQDFKEKSLSLAKVHAFFYPLMILLISVSTLITVYVGGLLLNQGVIEFGNIAEFVIYINYLTWPFTSIGWIASLVQQADASQKRINEFLDQDAKVINHSVADLNLKGDIEFRNVSFTYPETGIRALRNVSFKINAGQRLAIVGKTASGKSTIAELILRMYDIDEGEILIDGKSIHDINLDQLRKYIGYVPQDVFLFSDTINNNIIFGNQEANEEQARYYAQKAAIGDDIDEFEHQFETMVGERGVTLSGGQKQRLSIARAFIKEPQVVIMDDSLSAVDANTEHKILSYLNEALIDKTAIIITHRFFNLFSFDKIIVLEDGKIVESGTHDQLMANKSQYFELFSSDASKVSASH